MENAGKIVREFIPDSRYTRNSEGAFLRLTDGSILFAYSRFTNAWDDDAPSDVVAVRSDDEGETWSEPETLIEAKQYGAKNVMSVSLIRMQSGEMGLFYIVKQSVYENRILLSLSRDEGRTFHRHIECSLKDRPGYYVLNNDRVERLQSGRLIMALAFHRGGYNAEHTAYMDGRGVVSFLYSDDDGETWREARDTVSMHFPSSHTGLQEPGLIQKQNGALWAYFRTDRMCQYESFSLDEGETWTSAQPSRFTSPPSPMKIARHPETGALYAIWNPIPNYNGRRLTKAGWGRTPIVCATSADDGKTWSEAVELDGDPERGYCYPALFFTRDGAMLAAYCCGGAADGACLASMRVRKIAL